MLRWGHTSVQEGELNISETWSWDCAHNPACRGHWWAGALLRVSLGNELTARLGLPPAPAQGALSMALGSDRMWVELPGCFRVCTAPFPGTDQSLCPQSWVCLRTFCKCFSLTSREVSMALPGVPLSLPTRVCLTPLHGALHGQ